MAKLRSENRGARVVGVQDKVYSSIVGDAWDAVHTHRLNSVETYANAFHTQVLTPLCPAIVLCLQP